MNPYEDNDLVNAYEERYIHNEIVSNDIKTEIATVEMVMQERNYQNWCDVACGTGYHLRTAEGDYSRIGIDRSTGMLDYAKENDGKNTRFVQADFLELPILEKYDLVTNFWLGYTHQDTLADVMRFIYKMAEMVELGGTMIMSVHNHGLLYDNIPWMMPEPMDGNFQFDGIVWSYTEPSNPNLRYRCVSPHKEMIRLNLKKRFAGVKIIKYPIVVEGMEYPGREIMIFEDKVL
jgi:SAM-dependent methyltransferase